MYNAVKNSTLYKLIPEIHFVGPTLVKCSNRLLNNKNSNNIKMYKKKDDRGNAAKSSFFIYSYFLAVNLAEIYLHAKVRFHIMSAIPSSNDP